MKTRITVIALGALALTALPAGAQTTTIVTPPGSKTTVEVQPDGDEVIRVRLNDEQVPFQGAQPRMVSNRVMIPLRGVVERLGGRVLWHPADRSITGAHATSDDQFRIRVGSNEALVNGNRVALDAPPRIIGGTTYVPLRFVSEALGARVAWDNANRTVVITTDHASTTLKTGER